MMYMYAERKTLMILNPIITVARIGDQIEIDA